MNHAQIQLARPSMAEIDRRSTRYPALDGLRCLAVVMVILFHADLPWASGGAIGVDVFFVLSGYLITGQLWSRALVRGRIERRSFWVARARRLFPALVVVVLAAAVAMTVSGRDQLREFRGDFLAALGYVSNWWYVLHHRSYFAATGRPPVLQHLWSLAVEEQFYLVWPLVLAGILAWGTTWRARKALAMTVAFGLTAASALWMVVGTVAANVPYDNDGSRWYFGTDSHAFGLLLGAGLALLRDGDQLGLPASPGRTPRWLGLAGLAGLAVLIAAVPWLNSYRPGFYSYGLPAVSVAAVVLTAAVTRETAVARWLSWEPLRAIGKRSYGLYLWHWPVFQFTRPGLDLALDGPALLFVRLVLVFTLTEMSYQMIEKPLRQNGFRNTWRTLRTWRLGPVPGVALVAFVVAIIVAATFVVRGTDSPAASAGSASTGGAAGAVSGIAASALSVSAYGDSVMLGAVPTMKQTFGSVNADAVEGAQAAKVLNQVVADHDSGNQAPVVVLHVGDNGLIGESRLTAALDKLRDRKRVVLMTLYVDRDWQGINNQLISSMPAKYPNVRVADWHGFAQAHTDLLYSDGIHLRPSAFQPYTDLVAHTATEQ